MNNILKRKVRIIGNKSKQHELRELANCIRFLSVEAVQKAKSGHPGMPMGMADIATILFKSHIKFDPKNPKWIDRDRFVVSNGHGSMLLYSCLYLLGYKDITLENIKNFRQLNQPTAGHPEYGAFRASKLQLVLYHKDYQMQWVSYSRKKLSSKFTDKLIVTTLTFLQEMDV